MRKLLLIGLTVGSLLAVPAASARPEARCTEKRPCTMRLKIHDKVTAYSPEAFPGDVAVAAVIYIDGKEVEPYRDGLLSASYLRSLVIVDLTAETKSQRLKLRTTTLRRSARVTMRYWEVDLGNVEVLRRDSQDRLHVINSGV